jgi:hypothetical protein
MCERGAIGCIQLIKPTLSVIIELTRMYGNGCQSESVIVLMWSLIVVFSWEVILGEGVIKA